MFGAQGEMINIRFLSCLLKCAIFLKTLPHSNWRGERKIEERYHTEFVLVEAGIRLFKKMGALALLIFVYKNEKVGKNGKNAGYLFEKCRHSELRTWLAVRYKRCIYSKT